MYLVLVTLPEKTYNDNGSSCLLVKLAITAAFTLDLHFDIYSVQTGVLFTLSRTRKIIANMPVVKSHGCAQFKLHLLPRLTARRHHSGIYLQGLKGLVMFHFYKYYFSASYPIIVF